MLKIIDLEKSYSDGLFKKRKVLEKISFEIIPNKITGFLGPNGAGKTTTIKIIMGLLRADSGRIEFNGKGLDDVTRRKIGYLPENPSFYPFLTAREFLHIIGILNGIKKEVVIKETEKIANELFFIEFLDRKINTLSKGTLQKVAFAQSLIGDPELIILDEPFSGLDPIVMNEIRNQILLLREKNKAVLLSSHMLLEMERICDNVVLINKGKIVLKGSINELKKKWQIIKALENDEFKTIILRDTELNSFLKRVIEDDMEIWKLTNTDVFQKVLSQTKEPELEEIFLYAVKMADSKLLK